MVVATKKVRDACNKKNSISIYNIWTSRCCKLIFCKYQHAKFREGPRNINVAHTILKTDFEVWRVPFFMLTAGSKKNPEMAVHICSVLQVDSVSVSMSVFDKFSEV